MKRIEPWISANEAAEIISRNSGHVVHPDYVRLMARQHPDKIASKALNGREKIYLRTDVVKITVKAKKTKAMRDAEEVEEKEPEALAMAV